MGQISVKSVDIKYPGADSVKGRKDTQNISDDFKKLLKDQPKDQNEVSESGQMNKESEDIKDTDDNTKDTNAAEAAAQLQISQMMYQVQNVPVQEVPVSEAAVETADAGMEAVEGMMQNAELTEVPVQQEVMPAEKEADIQAEPEGMEQIQPQEAEAVPVQAQAQENHNAKTGEEKGSFEDSLAKSGEAKKEGPEVYESAQEGLQMQAAPVSDVRPAAAARIDTAEKMYVRQPEEIPQKLTEELLVKTANGINEFEIEIEPANLGKIAIKVLYEGGQTMISILCSEKKTLDMVGHNAREIGAVMEQNLGTATTVIVEKEETDYLHQGQNENDHSGRESEQDRQRETNEKEKSKADSAEQFLQKLRLGLAG